jgi:DNA-nicking Smr family endonuclease
VSEKLSHRPFADRADQLKKVARQAERAAKSSAASSRSAPKGREDPSSRPKTDKNEQPAPPSAQPPAPPQEDGQLFRQEMQGVKPLGGRDNYVPQQTATEPAPRPAQSDEAEVMAQLADLVAGQGTFDFAATDEYIEGIGVGLDRRLLKRLQRGHFAVQGHLDLHGKTRQEARPLVERFFHESRRHGKRCVLVVHGRGLNSKDQVPVLKESLKIWLAKGRIARSVLAFCSALPSDGGMGAVYVLLRK